MAVVSPTAKAQFIDAAGVPLAGGFLYTYEAGTTTPQATYTDSTSATANSNPIVLDSRGEANIWLASANYKFKLTDADGTEIWTVDNIAAPSTALSPVFTSNVAISTDSPGPALLITQSGAGPIIRAVDPADPANVLFTVINDGSVGIGTGSPAQALDVAGGAIQISTSGGTARTVMSADATDSIFSVNDDRNFTVKTNSTTRLTVNSTAATSTVPVVLPGVPTTSLQAATKSYVDTAQTTAAPPGAIMAYAASTAPTGWLLCDGSAVSRTTYATLFAAISTVWGTGDGSTTFNVPDLRGQFLRGYDSRVPGSGAVDTTIFTGTSTSGNTTISNIPTSVTAQLYAGMPITGAGISASTTIASVGSTSITLSANATASTVTLTGNTSTGAAVPNCITSLSSTTGLYVGQPVTGTNIPAGATIAAIDSSTQVTLSAPVTGTGSGITFTFYTKFTVGRTFAGYQGDVVGTHSHSIPVGNQTGLATTGAAFATRSDQTGGGFTTAINAIATTETRPKNYAVLYIIKT